ncbi:MAG: CHAP domain-containing protein [Saprospiraceae bacterium]
MNNMMSRWMYLSCLLIFVLTSCEDNMETYRGGQLGALPVSEPLVKTEKKEKPGIGTIIDRFNGVAIYYNGNLRNTDGRNVTSDGYNLGLKWQCVEFVKRYYYLRHGHRMPDPWGHAVDFYDKKLSDNSHNRKRNLRQFKNPSKHKPKVDDIIVFGPEDGNPFGHVAIVSKVGPNYIEIVQQNVGQQSRYTLPLFDMVDSWRIANIDVMGWLGKR